MIQTIARRHFVTTLTPMPTHKMIAKIPKNWTKLRYIRMNVKKFRLRRIIISCHAKNRLNFLLQVKLNYWRIRSIEFLASWTIPMIKLWPKIYYSTVSIVCHSWEPVDYSRYSNKRHLFCPWKRRKNKKILWELNCSRCPYTTPKMESGEQSIHTS